MTVNPDARHEALIERVIAAERQVRRYLAYDRSSPLLSVNLTMQQLKVVLLVATHEGLTSHELTRLLNVATPTVTGLVDRLVALDYVERREDPNDRRVRRIMLTPTGENAIRDILDAGAAHQRRLFARLDSDTLEDLERVLGKLAVAAHDDAVEHGHLPPRTLEG
jgi:DNA-binding MarR family transcriptional regulator